MEDIAPKLLEQLQEDFNARIKKNERLQSLLELVNTGKATYIQAEEAAYEMGVALSQSFGNCLSSAVLPDGKMYYNIAQRVVQPMLEGNHKLIVDVAEKVQTTLNQKAKLGLKAQTVGFSEDRAYGIVNKISEADVFDDVAWVLQDPVINFSQSIVDEILRENVRFQGRAGLTPKIIRKAERKCCKWCSALAGEYDYPDVPDDVYRRHGNCRCTVDYDPGDGRRKNVHTQRWTGSEENAILEKMKNTPGIVRDHRKTHPIDPDTGNQYTSHPVSFSDAQFGKKVGKHASDFGLRPDIQEDRAKMREIIDNIVENAEERCYGEWRGQESPVLFHILGDDVVVENKYQEFVTVLKGGTSSARVKKARGK